MDDNSAEIGWIGGSDPTNDAISGKVMLATVVILAIVCIIVAFFHIYSRWYLSRRSAIHQHPLPHHITTTTVTNTQHGLDPVLLKSIPTFTYSPTATATAARPLDCAICLSDFEELETVRILPKCNHCFHLDCIDMWFHSHTSCPLCRSPVQPIPESQFTESLIGETAEYLAVIVEVPVTTEREAELVPEPGSSNRFKTMVGPILSLKRFLSI